MLRITAPHFVVGIEPGKRSGPIVRYMLKWTEKRIIDYCNHKGWKVEKLSKEGELDGRGNAEKEYNNITSS